MRRLIIEVYIMWQSPESNCIKALYDIYKCMLIISEKKGLETLQKNILNFCQFLLSFL